MLSYSEFKEMAAQKKSFWQHVERPNFYEVFIIDGAERYSTIVWKVFEGMGVDPVLEAANLADYEANYLPDSNRPMDISPTAAQTQFYGKTIELAAGATSGYCEWSFDADTYISKVMPMPIDAKKGDTLDFEVWLKPGVSGPDAVKVGQYGYSIPIRGSYPLGWIYGSGGGLINQYCTVRCYYHKTDDTAREFNIIAEFLC
jgi:hypothetical protein